MLRAELSVRHAVAVAVRDRLRDLPNPLFSCGHVLRLAHATFLSHHVEELPLPAELAYLNCPAVLHPTRDDRDQAGVMWDLWHRAATVGIGFHGNAPALADT